MPYLRYPVALLCLVAACKFPELPDLTDAGDGDAAAIDGDSTGDGSTDGTPPTDAPIDALVNALGQVCTVGMASTCPAGHECIQITDGSGNMFGGWCSPMCMDMHSVCTTGYSGPSGGMPMCLVSDGTIANYCLIVCANNADCPTGLTCQAVGNPSISLCAKP